MDERVRIREKHAKVQGEVEQLEEGIKRDFLDHKEYHIVIKEHKIERIDRIRALFQTMKNDGTIATLQVERAYEC